MVVSHLLLYLVESLGYCVPGGNAWQGICVSLVVVVFKGNLRFTKLLAGLIKAE